MGERCNALLGQSEGLSVRCWLTAPHAGPCMSVFEAAAEAADYLEAPAPVQASAGGTPRKGKG